MNIDDTQSFCHLTTTGRRTGRPHTIEIWFGVSGTRPGRVYLLSGGGDRSDWVRNLLADPAVTIRVGETTWGATAAPVADPAEDALVRTLLATKYQGWREGQPLSNWARTAMPIAIDLGSPAEA
jgi:deazaflavin-dependent oxidoreductase (nitroreductase family)